MVAVIWCNKRIAAPCVCCFWSTHGQASGWISGEISSQKKQWCIGGGCPGKWWGHCSWRYSRTMETWHWGTLGMVAMGWWSDLMILEVFSNLYDSVILFHLCILINTFYAANYLAANNYVSDANAWYILSLRMWLNKLLSFYVSGCNHLSGVWPSDKTEK